LRHSAVSKKEGQPARRTLLALRPRMVPGIAIPCDGGAGERLRGRVYLFLSEYPVVLPRRSFSAKRLISFITNLPLLRNDPFGL